MSTFGQGTSIYASSAASRTTTGPMFSVPAGSYAQLTVYVCTAGSVGSSLCGGQVIFAPGTYIIGGGDTLAFQSTGASQFSYAYVTFKNT